MKSALSLTLIVCLLASVVPVTAQAQMERPGSFDLRGPATPATAGPLSSAMTGEAIRVAAGGEAPGGVHQVETPAVESEPRATSPQSTADRHSRADATVSISWFHVNAEGHRYAPGYGAITVQGADYAHNVYGPEYPITPALQISGGYYWNEHLKSEIEVGWNGTRTDQYDSDPPCPLIAGVIRCDLIAGTGRGTFLTHNYRMFRMSLAQVLSGPRDGRFRPYVGVGAGVYADDEWDARGTGASIYDEGTIDGPRSHRTLVHGFAKAGFKVYGAERVFFINELKIGNPEGWTLKLGLGVDF